VLHSVKLWLYLQTNRLGWKGLPVTNTLAYYERSLNFGAKKFYDIGPWWQFCKTVFFVNDAMEK
jgi:hypothetical protein